MRSICFAVLRRSLTLSIVGLMLAPSVGFGKALSADEVRQILVDKSIASYAGSCPCPENRDRAGRRCGKRSAYSRPGGNAPYCYKSDVPEAEVRNYMNADSLRPAK